MTNDEAIKTIKNLPWAMTGQQLTALDMAIEALNQGQSRFNQGQSRFNQGQSSDLIRRQAAIDALIEWYGCEPSDIGAFENIIEKLPSAQPEIIRCKDCKHSDIVWNCPFGLAGGENFFCGYGAK